MKEAEIRLSRGLERLTKSFELKWRKEKIRHTRRCWGGQEAIDPCYYAEWDGVHYTIFIERHDDFLDYDSYRLSTFVIDGQYANHEYSLLQAIRNQFSQIEDLARSQAVNSALVANGINVPTWVETHRRAFRIKRWIKLIKYILEL